MKNLFAAYKTIHSLHIRSSAVLVYYYLCAQTNRENECWPSKNTIAKACHVSVSTVTRALRELEAAGMVVTVYRFRKGSNRQTSNIYKVYDTPQEFTQPPEDMQPKQEQEPVEEDFDTQPIQNAPAVCSVSDIKPSYAQNAPEPPLSEPNVNMSSYQDSEQRRAIAAPRRTESGLYNALPSSLKQNLLLAALSLLPSQNDMLSRITVTPQGTSTRTKVTDSLRVKSIFSKLTKRKKGRSAAFDAGFRNCPAQNE